MASLISGYEYDVFISYRQKDNKHDGWVTEFVDNLKGELESTFKEEISVYFDINPHDGLLETHDVDASLKDKLKCLVFIPIISRTYCDPKSFAWEHEFKAFVESASQDQLGLKVKLTNGNVANRILQIQIHDITANDKAHIEKELGGVLRAIEFIYKEPGVNKPLTANDDEKLNLNKTKYRIQINKVANAIDEIISGLKAEPNITPKEKTPTAKEPVKDGKKEEKKEQKEKPAKLNKRKLLSGVAILAILIIAAVFAYPKIFKHDKLEKLRSSGEKISVAVMPFQNMTNDTTWNIWQDGIQEILTSTLSAYEELRVKQTESIKHLIQSKGFTNYALITPSIAGNISQKLNADVFVYGKIMRSTETLRVTAQIIESKSEDIIKSFQIDGMSPNILKIIDSLSSMLKDFLVISKLKKEAYLNYDPTTSLPTNNPEAYKSFTKGEKAHMEGDDDAAKKLFSKAIDIDSNFILPAIMLAYTYGDEGNLEEAKKWCLRIYVKKDQIPLQYKLIIKWLHAIFFETPFEQIKYLKQLQEFDEQNPDSYLELGLTYLSLCQFDKAISQLEKALDIHDKWNLELFWGIPNYTGLGSAYHETRQYKKEKELYKKAEKDFMDNPDLVYRQVVLSLTEGDKVASNQYIEKYISVLKEKLTSEADIEINLAQIYSEAGIVDKAEVYFRQSLSFEPNNPDRLNALAYFLIDKDRNISEGMELNDKALILSPDNYGYMDTKGLGLYKQGKYQEALNILQKSWDLRRKLSFYNHTAFLHLEAAKKAVAEQK